MKPKRRLIYILFVCFLVFFIPTGIVSASSDIRVTGFNNDRSFVAFADSGGNSVDDDIVGTNVLIQALLNSDNFGSSGVVSCGVEMMSFIEEIQPGQLVGSDGKRLADVFIGGTTDWQLSDSEADELAKFIRSGGVVHVSGGTEITESVSYRTGFKTQCCNETK